MNPYAHHLDDRSLDAILTSTPDRLHEVACALTPEQLNTPVAPGKWSPRETLAHMADCELAFSFRLRQVLAAAPGDPPPTLQPFDQTAWGTRYQAYDVPDALALFRANREWNLALVSTLAADDLARPGFHPERGAVTFQTVLETMAGHDLHHLKQLQALPAMPAESDA